MIEKNNVNNSLTIKFDGIITKNKIYYICFSNDQQKKVEIPIDHSVANRISQYLNFISPGNVISENKIIEEENGE